MLPSHEARRRLRPRECIVRSFRPDNGGASRVGFARGDASGAVVVSVMALPFPSNLLSSREQDARVDSGPSQAEGGCRDIP